MPADNLARSVNLLNSGYGGQQDQQIWEPLNPVADGDVEVRIPKCRADTQGYLKHAHEQIIISAIEEGRREVSVKLGRTNIRPSLPSSLIYNPAWRPTGIAKSNRSSTNSVHTSLRRRSRLRHLRMVARQQAGLQRAGWAPVFWVAALGFVLSSSTSDYRRTRRRRARWSQPSQWSCITG